MDASLQTLAVRRVPSSADLERPGDYCFIGKRAPIRKFEPVAESGRRWCRRMRRRSGDGEVVISGRVPAVSELKNILERRRA
jgi:hypothetical protein